MIPRFAASRCCLGLETGRRRADELKLLIKAGLSALGQRWRAETEIGGEHS
jgi:hypothetical protein